VSERWPAQQAPAMSAQTRRRVLWGIAAVVLVLMAAGAVAAWSTRNDGFCSNGEPPVAERNIGMGMIEYRCSDGETVRPGLGP
jgi:hypothetical protein